MARNNKKNDYFEMMYQMCEFTCEAAVKLRECFRSFDVEDAEGAMWEIHEIEHRGDEARHRMMEKLMRDFITPIEREDIYELIQIIDDITDAIDDVPIKMYMYNVVKPVPRADEFCEIIVRITSALREAVAELGNYKRSQKLHPLIVEINNIESEGDALYMQTIRDIYTDDSLDAVDKMSFKEICECFEMCCDLCEHAADAIENAVMKNS